MLIWEQWPQFFRGIEQVLTEVAQGDQGSQDFGANFPEPYRYIGAHTFPPVGSLERRTSPIPSADAVVSAQSAQTLEQSSQNVGA